MSGKPGGRSGRQRAPAQRSLQELQKLFAGVAPGTDEFDTIWKSLSPEEQARVPRQPRVHLVPEGEVKWKIGRKAGAGRPRRDRTGDARQLNVLIAALRSAPCDHLHGAHGRRTQDACERYLERHFPDTPREIIRKAAEAFCNY
jgi:hypothetical protein